MLLPIWHPVSLLRTLSGPCIYSHYNTWTTIAVECIYCLLKRSFKMLHRVYLHLNYFILNKDKKKYFICKNLACWIVWRFVFCQIFNHLFYEWVTVRSDDGHKTYILSLSFAEVKLNGSFFQQKGAIEWSVLDCLDVVASVTVNTGICICTNSTTTIYWNESGQSDVHVHVV